MKKLLFPLFAAPSLTKSIQANPNIEVGNFKMRSFPDQETYLKFDSDVNNREIIFLATLDRPNEKFLPLYFAAQTARSLGASRCGLIAPYLSYMRQDSEFNPGEAITSHNFATLLSSSFDWLITVDPHLHRIRSLNEIYSIPNQVLNATTQIANWIRQYVKSPVIIGPDSESEQWAADIAQKVNAPLVMLKKVRFNDREVEIVMPDMLRYLKHTPVLIDDIISTGQTLVQAVKALNKMNTPAPICIAVHAVFVPGAYEDLMKAGVSKIITCNTIEHQTNGIDLGELIRLAIDTTH